MGGIRRRGVVGLGVTGLVAPLALAVTAAPAQAASCTTSTGPYQKQVEKFLGRPVDGRQSAADCTAIRAFQSKHGITPTIGYAGSVTWGVMDLMNKQKAVGNKPNKDGKCPVNKGRIRRTWRGCCGTARRRRGRWPGRRSTRPSGRS
ncbi:peptidoglycan-binding domain-containing protein, partial [Streptomyces eurythermus]